MTTETEKSPREIAEQIAAYTIGKVKLEIYHAIVSDISHALGRERERAVAIIKEHREGDKCEGSCWEIIASAIRGKS